MLPLGWALGAERARALEGRFCGELSSLACPTSEQSSRDTRGSFLELLSGVLHPESQEPVPKEL
jgi:hypothetical protein